MNQLALIAAASAPEKVKPTYLFVWEQLEGPGLAIIVILVLISTCAWAVMAYKAKQLRHARKYNRHFEREFRRQTAVMDMFERDIRAEGCPHFNVYRDGCMALEERLRDKEGNRVGADCIGGWRQIKPTLIALLALCLVWCKMGRESESPRHGTNGFGIF